MGFKLANGYIINNESDQIEYNKRNIEKHFEVDRVLADFGIRIIGRVDTAELLPSANDYEYGDAFAVGLLEATTYDYWICTRPFEEGQGKHWFDIGPLQIVGPQGPQGEQGEKGPTGYSTRWYIYQWSADLSSNPPKAPGDIALVKNGGKIYLAIEQNGGVVWADQGYSITGPKGDKGDKGDRGPQGEQGIQGPIGPTGPRGLGLVILGELNNVDALPSPASVRRDGAYLIGSPKHLWAITGTTTLVWEDLGEYALTSSGGGSKLYLHNLTLYFSALNTQENLDVKIINSSSEKITVASLYNELQSHKVGVISKVAYGNSSYHIFCDIYTTSDGEDDFYELVGVEFASWGTSTFSEYIWSMNSVYDSVTEL